MSQASYANPPVHEVVIDLLFAKHLSEGALNECAARINKSDVFSTSDRLEESRIEASVHSSGQSRVSTDRQFVGWKLESETGLILRLLKNRLTLNVLRSRGWPSGPYAGWDWIWNQFETVFGMTGNLYANVPLRRLGLRYLNKLSIPAQSDPTDWLTVYLAGPAFLDGIGSFHLSQTWTEIRDFEGYSVQVRLLRIDPPETREGEDEVGMLLDIDAFTWTSLELENGLLLNWYDKAHRLINEVFEASLTDRLRAKFGVGMEVG